MDPTIKLIAAAQEMSMTIPRRQACMVYGKLNVTLKKGDTQQEQDKRLTNGYIHIPDDMPTGSFDFGFTREDADINIETQQSTYELALDTAARRITGQVLFEQDVTAPGFGDWRPMIDFSCGDVVGVRVWGKELPLPVTSITRETSQWRVHVGGQLINDRRKVVSENRKILADIESERRERSAEITRVSEIAEKATSAAEAADEKAGEAQETAQDALSKWQQQKDELDALQTRQIKELEAQNAAVRRLGDIQEPLAGSISDYDALTLGPVKITYPARNKIDFELLSGHEFVSGASVLVNARVNAISQYTHSFPIRLTTSRPKASGTVGWAENYSSASILVIPTADFSAILSEERRKRGLY
ncbi:immunity-specific protein [Corynebacterium phage LGCM-V6]|uniref:hypothetical protein n=1 Tax=Corynebacterium pseudotuberculosis TaxID=1719 RepID=UPI00065E4B8F|nr:hypothetical protein [Corynebacterium pseudotuberculosis]AQY55168.1 immunity-specific protein beta371 [Corynebacterium phage LGCM-VI]ARM68572.1 immunity-specific protein [Corynebacterium phage LGCM-V2]ARM68620.1 immunity-specific protein [Corynebacterium phage LGCM-V3]ARM68669.1 immunity-specific protein [Corynebacterium phage LGCM-V4]ARM68717.1 immunity-specific protein [Corynebacterium phage LGCM-V6]ARM68765.1 immunity-specific protein [Corynebacterium phage LGCM-V5]ARM68813.1 immunity-